MATTTAEGDILSAIGHLGRCDDDEVKYALACLVAAVTKINQREQLRAKYANRLIAENMFAIVRLEIAHATDQIINTALAVKRERTGSGKAEFALNVTGTLVMLAGNVLSGGSMSLLGNLLVASGEIIKAGAKNDLVGVLGGIVNLGAASVSIGTNEGKKERAKQQEKGISLQQTSDVEDGKVETRSTTDGIAALVKTAGEGVLALGGQLHDRFKTEDKEDLQYKVVKRTTVWIEHGAGGTHAIRVDVQEAMMQAYANALGLINNELKEIGATDRQPRMGTNSVLGQIMSAPMNPTAKLHPLTSWVVSEAIRLLAASGGTRYQALTGGSGMFGRESVLNSAKRDVKEAYSVMLSSAGIVEVDVVQAHIKKKFG